MQQCHAASWWKTPNLQCSHGLRLQNVISYCELLTRSWYLPLSSSSLTSRVKPTQCESIVQNQIITCSLEHVYCPTVVALPSPLRFFGRTHFPPSPNSNISGHSSSTRSPSSVSAADIIFPYYCYGVVQHPFHCDSHLGISVAILASKRRKSYLPPAL